MKRIYYLLFFSLACEEDSVPSEPHISAIEISQISPHQASLKTTMKFEGLAADYGFAFGTDSTRLTAVSKKDSTVSKDQEITVTAALTDLQPSTTYFVKAYLVDRNQVHYSPLQTFSTPSPEGLLLNTGSATDVAYAGARLHGEILHPGNLVISEIGLEWGKNEGAEPVSKYSLHPRNPEYPLNFNYFAGQLDQNTTYYFRSYIKAGNTYFYGPLKTFQTEKHFFPQLLTGDVQTGETSATVHGSMEKKGSHTISEYGIVYGTAENPTTQDTKKSIGTAPLSYPLKFRFDLTDLLPATTYHYRTYASMNGVTSYGADKTFTTGMVIPSITTLYASQLALDGASLNARLDANGTFPPTEVGILYGHSTEAPLIKVKHHTYDIPTPYQYSVNLKGLMDNQTYHYRAYVVTKGQMYYGELRTFTTLKAKSMTIQTSENYTNLGINGLKVEGEIDPGTYTLSEHGFQYSFQRSGPPTTIKVPKSGNAPHKISTIIPYPGCDQTVYYRAYALGLNGYSGHGTMRTIKTNAC